jgi:hypothetical protein
LILVQSDRHGFNISFPQQITTFPSNIC